MSFVCKNLGKVSLHFLHLHNLKLAIHFLDNVILIKLYLASSVRRVPQYYYGLKQMESLYVSRGA